MESTTHVAENNNEHLQLKSYVESTGAADELSHGKRKASESPDSSKTFEPNDKKLKSICDVSRYIKDDRCVYGNPKEPSATVAEVFDANSVLDLSCKGTKSPELPKPKPSSDLTYQNPPRSSHTPISYLPDPFARSNLEIKLVNAAKRPNPSEQLQIAKLQQQQRRSVQQQQKLLQQMRRSLDAVGGRQTLPGGEQHKKQAREEVVEAPKEDYQSTMMTPASFPPHPYYDQAHTAKELPDGHPILPLLDPVYFSALYNAHGFMPPSSPSIAAAFIGTLQDALPKLSMMFPPTTSSSGSSLLPHKTNENPN